MTLPGDRPETRVLFAPGAIRQLPAEIAALGADRAFVITTGGRSAAGVNAPALLGGVCVDVFQSGREHVPMDTVVSALARFGAANADVCIAIGGGSPIGLGKALARRTGVPLVAVPTTYSGSEMTSIWGETDEAGKRTGRDPAAQPRLVIYDVSLTLTFPAAQSAASGMNAMAHAAEALYAANATDATRAMAEDAARRLAESLPAVVVNERDLEARTRVFQGAHLAGRVLEATSMGLHHRICHVLGGTFRMPHAPTHAAVLPHVIAFNAPAAADAMTRLGRAIGNADCAAGLTALNHALDIRASLGDLGLRRDDVDRAADEVAATPYPNPRPVTRDDVRALLQSAL